MIFELDLNSEQPIYRQLRQQIILGIAKGQLAPGDQLPTVRQIADELGVNMMTVSKGYQQLKEEGYLVADRRRGTLVNTLPTTSKRPEDQKLSLLLAELYLSGQSKTQLKATVNTILTTFSEEEFQ